MRNDRSAWIEFPASRAVRGVGMCLWIYSRTWADAKAAVVEIVGSRHRFVRPVDVCVVMHHSDMAESWDSVCVMYRVRP